MLAIPFAPREVSLASLLFPNRVDFPAWSAGTFAGKADAGCPDGLVQGRRRGGRTAPRLIQL